MKRPTKGSTARGKKKMFTMWEAGHRHYFKYKGIIKENLEKALNLKFRKKNLLITYHPETLDSIPSRENVKELLSALDNLGEKVGLILQNLTLTRKDER